MTKQPSCVEVNLIPSDEEILNQLMIITGRRSKSDLVRESIDLMYRVWLIASWGNRIVMRNSREMRQHEVSLVSGKFTGYEQAASKVRKVRSTRKKGNLKVKLDEDESFLISRMSDAKANDAAREDIVRSSLSLMFHLFSYARPGWKFLALGPMGDIFPIPLPMRWVSRMVRDDG